MLCSDTSESPRGRHARNDLAEIPTTTGSPSAFGHAATGDDTRTKSFDSDRRGAVVLLPVQPGDVVLDVEGGTGRSLSWLVDRVGPTGTVVGVDPAEEMLPPAQQEVTAHAWTNVVLIHPTGAQAVLPIVHYALFRAVHDGLQSTPAIDHVVEHVREGGTVAAAVGTWAPDGGWRSPRACWQSTGPTFASPLSSGGPGRFWRIASPTWS